MTEDDLKGLYDWTLSTDNFNVDMEEWFRRNVV